MGGAALTAGGTAGSPVAAFAQAMRSFIEPVMGPQAAVCASRTASSSDPAEAVTGAGPPLELHGDGALHALGARSVDQSRKATKARTTRTVMLRGAVAFMRGGTCGR